MTTEEKAERQSLARAALMALADQVHEGDAERATFKAQMSETFRKADDSMAMVRALGLPGFSGALLVPFWSLVVLFAIADGLLAAIAIR